MSTKGISQSKKLKKANKVIWEKGEKLQTASNEKWQELEEREHEYVHIYIRIYVWAYRGKKRKAKKISEKKSQ